MHTFLPEHADLARPMIIQNKIHRKNDCGEGGGTALFFCFELTKKEKENKTKINKV